MSQTLEAVFDGKVLRPMQPVELQPDTRVRIVIEHAIVTPEVAPQSFLRTARALKLEGPPDWSERIEEYLSGEAGNDPT